MTSPWWASVLSVLGIEELRPHQQPFTDIIEQQNDALILLPTGYGKSLFYQLVPHYGDTQGNLKVYALYCGLSNVLLQR